MTTTHRRGKAALSALAVAGLVALAGCTAPVAPAPAGSPPPATAAPGAITEDSVKAGVGALDGIVNAGMTATGIPGVAVAVVHQGEVVYAKGFGLREVGKPEAVDTGTVFQLASVSKSISSTVIAAAVKQGKVAWDVPVQKFRPGFTLSDPWVGSHVTVADMFSHRSGLPDHAGDILEDLGYQQDQIIERLRFLPLEPFREAYEYTNYGLTAAGETVAAATGVAWPDLAQQELFGPLGMTSTSFRFADLQKRSDRAALHVQVNGAWKPDLTFDPDRQAPAGGATSSVDDLAKWMTMLLGGGAPVLDEASLLTIWQPHSVRQPAEHIGDRTGFYGLGWNIDTGAGGRVTVQHSGAFAHGAGTNVLLVPGEQLGIVSLTNGYPVGLPEAINNGFLDQVENGKQTRDWVALFKKAFDTVEGRPDPTDYSKPPATVAPTQAATAYTGTYHSDFWGDLVVREGSGGLEFTIGPGGLVFPLSHYTGDTFFFTQQGESATGTSGLVFGGSPGRAGTLTVNAWNVPAGPGVFTRTG